MSEPDPNGGKKVDTQGGTYVDGNVDTSGGDVVGRDKNVYILGISTKLWVALIITLITISIRRATKT